jgi:biotin operon repressor
MLDWLFGNKKSVEKLEEDTKKSFNSVKEDIDSLSKWIKHLNSQDDQQKDMFRDVEERLSSLENEIEGLKNSLALVETGFSKQLFKQPQTAVYKQTAVEGVQNGVQTVVQTAGSDFFQGLSTMERALVHILLFNSDMKLSYDDLAAMLGKSRATIRGQINTIKQKSEGLIEETIEKNGKKRVFIPEEVRNIMLKSSKVRVNKGSKNSRNEY